MGKQDKDKKLAKDKASAMKKGKGEVTEANSSSVVDDAGRPPIDGLPWTHLLPCPCVSTVSFNKVLTAIEESKSIADRKHSKEKELVCLTCSASAPAGGDQQQGGKTKNKPATTKAPNKGKNDANTKGKKSEPLAVCMTCGNVFCIARHAEEHYHSEISRNKNARNKANTISQGHSIYLFASFSTPAHCVVRCFHCDLNIGIAGINGQDEVFGDDVDIEALSLMDSFVDLQEEKRVSGIPCNKLGYAVDLAGELSKELHLACLGALKILQAPPVNKNSMKSSPSKNARKEEKRQQKQAQYDEIRADGMKGLQNLGNTCFMNSTIQMLNQCSVLHSYMSSTANHTGSVTVSLVAFLKKMSDSTQGAVLAPQVIHKVLCERARHFQGYDQHDAHDFLVTMLDFIEREKKLEYRNSTSVVKDPNGIVERCFRGEILSTVVCHNCGERSVRTEEFNHLSVDTRMPSEICQTTGHEVIPVTTLVSAADAAPDDGLLKGLVSFFLPELMIGENGYLCEKCCAAEYESWVQVMEQQKREQQEALLRMEQEGTSLKLDDAMKAEEGAEGLEDDDDSSSSEEGGEEGEEGRSTATTPTPPPQQQPSEQKSNNNNYSPPPPPSTEEQQPQPQQADAIVVAHPTPPPPSAPPTRTYVPATKQMAIQRLPPVLIIHVKRFRLNWTTASWVKDDRKVSIPKHIDMKTFLAPTFKDEFIPPQPTRLPPQAQPLAEMFPGLPVEDCWVASQGNFDRTLNLLLSLQEKKERSGGSSDPSVVVTGGGEGLQYRLCGIVEHQGSIRGGHYVAYVRKFQNPAMDSWFYCSDSCVRKVSEHEALQSQPYLLLYERF